MSIAKIRAALEKRLTSVTPAIITAYENVTISPALGVPYQRSNLLPNTPDDAFMGSQTYFERGIYQVTVCFPMGNGPGACEARVQLVKDAFKRGTSFVEQGLTVMVMNAPSVSSAMIDGDRFCIPISIRYKALIS